MKYGRGMLSGASPPAGDSNIEVVDIQPTVCVFAATPPPPAPPRRQPNAPAPSATWGEALAVAPQGALALARALYLLSFYNTTR